MRRSYFFLRHGRAVYQENGFDRSAYPKGTDWPLAPVGHREAAAVAPFLLASGVETLFSSSLRRAIQTAECIVAETALPYVSRWSELNELEPSEMRRLGGKRPEWWDGWAMSRALRRHRDGRRVSGWEIEGVAARIEGVLQRLDEREETRLAIVGHGFWILLLTVWLGGPSRPRWIHNCSVTRVDADGAGRYRLAGFAQRPFEVPR